MIEDRLSNEVPLNQLPAKFITFEGIDGVGKSTQVKLLAAFLSQHGVKQICTREPGGSPLAEQIRQLLLATRGSDMADLTELLLIFAARAEHIQQTILPALTSGRWVISDRFTDATYAYQGGGRQLDSNKIELLEKLVQENLKPDLTILLDMEPGQASHRRALRGEAGDRFESSGDPFLNRVREAYLERAQATPERYLIVPAAQDVQQIHQQIVQGLKRYFAV